MIILILIYLIYYQLPSLFLIHELVKLAPSTRIFRRLVSSENIFMPNKQLKKKYIPFEKKIPFLKNQPQQNASAEPHCKKTMCQIFSVGTNLLSQPTLRPNILIHEIFVHHNYAHLCFNAEFSSSDVFSKFSISVSSTCCFLAVPDDVSAKPLDVNFSIIWRVLAKYASFSCIASLKKNQITSFFSYHIIISIKTLFRNQVMAHRSGHITLTCSP